MKIAVIGTGNVGSVLGQRWAQSGHNIIWGTRDPENEKIKKLLENAEGSIKATEIKDAIDHSQIVVFAVPYQSLQAICQSSDLKDKVIIDCTNPLKEDLSGLMESNISAAEQIAQWSRSSRVVKAFNSVGSKIMEDPTFEEDKALMLICGDDKQAKGDCTKLSKELGFDVIDAGGLNVATHLEHLAMLWIHLAFKQRLGFNFAFKYLKR